MKKIILAALFTVLSSGAYSQNLNWKRLNDNERTIAQLSVGYEFAFTSQLGVYHLLSLYRPIILGVSVSLPMGSDLVDDLTVHLTSNTQLIESDGFVLTAKVASNFRRYQNAFVRSVGFTADFAGIAGYYSDSWHTAAEFGFEKAVTTNLIHSDAMRAEYPSIKDGWYVPTGGHYYYGIQAGKSISNRFDLGMRVGATRPQFDDANAVLPYYLQLGVGLKL